MQTLQVFLTSPAFDHLQRMPRRFTCDGEDLSPPLDWHGVPDEAQTLTLVMEDPDAPRGLFTHWTYYNLPATVRQLPEGVEKTASPSTGGEQGLNDFGNVGYNGPCPPRGRTHQYHLILYALDGQLDLPPSCSPRTLRESMRGHIVAQGELIATYGRDT